METSILTLRSGLEARGRCGSLDPLVSDGRGALAHWADICGGLLLYESGRAMKALSGYSRHALGLPRVVKFRTSAEGWESAAARYWHRQGARLMGPGYIGPIHRFGVQRLSKVSR